VLDDDDEITILKVVVDGEALQRARLEESIPGNSQMEDPECDVCIVIVRSAPCIYPRHVIDMMCCS